MRQFTSTHSRRTADADAHQFIAVGRSLLDSGSQKQLGGDRALQKRSEHVDQHVAHFTRCKCIRILCVPFLWLLRPFLHFSVLLFTERYHKNSRERGRRWWRSWRRWQSSDAGNGFNIEGSQKSGNRHPGQIQKSWLVEKDTKKTVFVP